VVVGILRRFIGKPSWGGEEDHLDPLAGVPDQAEALIDDLLVKLRMVRDDLASLKYKITEEIEKYYEKYRAARAAGNRDEAEVAAAEFVLKKKILKAVLTYIKLLDATIERLNDAKDINSVIKSMLTLEHAFKTVSAFLVQESPEVAAKVATVVASAENLISFVGTMASSMPTARSPMQLDPELRALLAESLKEASAEAEKLTPKIEAGAENRLDYDVLERRLIEYIRRSGGVVRVKEAAAWLGVSPNVVREVLYRLERKGVIRINGAGQASAV